MRIVTLLPSATEIVCQLGLGDDLVGVTHECDYPPKVRSLPKVTRTRIPADADGGSIDAMVREQLQDSNALYELERQTLADLKPDLIVTQALCDVCAVAESDVQAAASRLPNRPLIVNLEPMRLAEVYDSIEQVGEAAGVPQRAAECVNGLKRRVESVAQRSRSIDRRRRIVFLEWLDPPFSAGHWTPELIRIAGADDVLGGAGEMSRTITWSEILQADPDALVAACCGFDVDKTVKELSALAGNPDFQAMDCVRRGEVYAIDGNAYFNRPGPRLVDGLEILANTLFPDLHPSPRGMTDHTTGGKQTHGVLRIAPRKH